MKNSEFLEKIFELEKKHSLFESTTSEGIHWWDVVRYSVYIELLFLTVRKPSPKAAGEKKSRVRLLHLLFQDIKYLFNSRNRKITTFFATQPRSIDKNGFSVDLISQDCLSIVKSQSFIIDGLQTGCTKERSYNNAALLLFRKLFKLTAKKNFLNTDINSILNKEFNVDFDFEGKINILLDAYKADRLYYNQLLSFIKPRIVLFTATGGEKGLMAAAKALGIETAELQHGQANRYHLYYTYPEGVKYSNNLTIPDTFLSFSEHWHTVNYPVKSKISIGNSLFNNMTNSKVSIKRDSFLVISSELYASDLIPLIQSLVKTHRDVPVIFKLHPQQQQYEIEATKQAFLGSANVKIISTEKTTPELLNQATAVIAIQSTVVYEALQLGVKVFLYAKQDFESHDDVFNNPNVFIVNKAEDIINKVTAPFVKIDQDDFFMAFDKDKLINFLDDSGFIRDRI